MNDLGRQIRAYYTAIMERVDRTSAAKLPRAPVPLLRSWWAIAGVAGLLVLIVGGVTLLVVGGGSDEVVQPATSIAPSAATATTAATEETAGSSVATAAATATPSSTTTPSVQRGPSWTVNPLLAPFDALPSCGDPSELVAWAAETHPGWGGDAEAASPLEVAQWVPLMLDLQPACITAVASGTHLAWEMRDSEGGLLARTAGGFGDGTGLSPCMSQPGAYDASFYQGRVGSGHWMSSCLIDDRLFGGIGRILEGRWPIFEIDIPLANRPATTRWPGGWVGAGSDLQPIMERLFLSRTDQIVDVHEWDWLPAQWPPSVAPCSRYTASLGDPDVEPNGSPRVEVIELCDEQGSAYRYVRSSISLAPSRATVDSVEGIDVAVWQTEAGGLAAESTLKDFGFEIPRIESVGPQSTIDELEEVLASMPGFDLRYLEPSDGVGNMTSILTEEWLLGRIEAAGWTPVPLSDLPPFPVSSPDFCEAAVCSGLEARGRGWWLRASLPESPGGPTLYTPIRGVDVVTYRGVDVFSNNRFAMAGCGGIAVEIGSDQTGDPVDVLLPILDAMGCTLVE